MHTTPALAPLHGAFGAQVSFLFGRHLFWFFIRFVAVFFFRRFLTNRPKKPNQSTKTNHQNKTGPPLRLGRLPRRRAPGVLLADRPLWAARRRLAARLPRRAHGIAGLVAGDAHAAADQGVAAAGDGAAHRGGHDGSGECFRLVALSFFRLRFRAFFPRPAFLSSFSRRRRVRFPSPVFLRHAPSHPLPTSAPTIHKITSNHHKRPPKKHKKTQKKHKNRSSIPT